MAISASQFILDLVTTVPEAKPTVEEQLADQDGELLMYLMAYDLGRLAVRWFDEGRNQELTRLLEALDLGIREGDEYLVGAIAVSFVEDLPWWEEELAPLIRMFPQGLRREVDRLRRPVE